MLRGWQDRASAEQGGRDLPDVQDATVMVVKVRPGH